ncbi:hypothetical protein RFI_32333 [Reticulomyxa filosa]|uniref:Uncharacterized protein n=1 Tax=Reticulomyxa filosa TaxID=46433 RepID=X6LV93_RETFI|nr:hypothetical protein RFI_32333 [Reticulomyxa filosa]|eukprot:ETO05062.1 hypothetical protein RFI_32333 [Reticulomyxa filosa]
MQEEDSNANEVLEVMHIQFIIYISIIKKTFFPTTGREKNVRTRRTAATIIGKIQKTPDQERKEKKKRKLKDDWEHASKKDKSRKSEISKKKLEYKQKMQLIEQKERVTTEDTYSTIVGSVLLQTNLVTATVRTISYHFETITKNQIRRKAYQYEKKSFFALPASSASAKFNNKNAQHQQKFAKYITNIFSCFAVEE